MLVEDEKIFNFITTKLLNGIWGNEEIMVAFNGKEALGLINDCFSGARSFPSLVLVDLNMPIMDGFTFIEAFKKLSLPADQKTTIAVLTSSKDEGDLARATALGIEHYLVKPVTESDLRTVMKAAGIF